MSLEKKLLNLKEDIKHVKDGVEFSKPAIIGEVYPNPTNLYLDEFSSVCAFIKAEEAILPKESEEATCQKSITKNMRF